MRGSAAVGRETGEGAGLIRALTFAIFLVFAMTTDAVGVIIPQVIRDLHLSMTAAGRFQYASQGGVALAGLGLGFLADRIGRKRTILLGLSLFALDALLFGLSRSFAAFSVLMFISGLAVGVFKTGALALIGDISPTPRAHIANMNLVEAFFGVGAILGPLAVAALIAHGAGWKWLYGMVGGVCAVVVCVTAGARFPARAPRPAAAGLGLRRTLALTTSPWALGFGAVIMLYVGVEASVTVWMPTLLAGPGGPAPALAACALPMFFVLRACGRFAGAWVLRRLRWTAALAACGLAILACFVLAVTGGRAVAAFALPTAGLFMSVLYPTLNSKGISCFPAHEHGAVSGVLLFFTCLSGVAAPLAMGVVSDRAGDAAAGFLLAAVFAALLFAVLFGNWLFDPSREVLGLRERERLQSNPLLAA